LQGQQDVLSDAGRYRLTYTVTNANGEVFETRETVIIA
jgi:PKD repeat protein